MGAVAQSCLTLCDPMDCNTPDFPVHHQLPELMNTHAHRVSGAINHLILCLPLLLLPSFFLSIGVFSNESGLHNRWPKYWSFSFSISSSSNIQDRFPFSFFFFKKQDYLVNLFWLVQRVRQLRGLLDQHDSSSGWKAKIMLVSVL